MHQVGNDGGSEQDCSSVVRPRVCLDGVDMQRGRNGSLLGYSQGFWFGQQGDGGSIYGRIFSGRILPLV